MRGVVVVVVVAAFASGCWPEWAKLFDVTPSREHRVEDLRVLGIRAEPAAFYVGRDGSAGDVVITPFIYDPRGGEITMRIGLCALPSVFDSCVDVPIEVRSASLIANGQHPLGRVDDAVTTLRLGPADVQELVALTTASLSGVPIFVTVVVDVTRPGADPAERERATLTLPLRLDPSRVDDVSQDPGVRLCVDPADPVENAVCLGEALPGLCGDAVVDAGESCDPPDGALCSAECLSSDPCAVFGSPPCLERLPANMPPRIVGFDTDPGEEDFALRVADQGFDVVAGGAIEFTRGQTLRFGPVVDVEGAFDPVQDFFPPSFDRRCEALLTAACPTFEVPSVRFYVRDGRFDLEVNTGGAVNETGNTIAELSVGEDTEAKDEVVVVVVSDSRGGLDVVELTVRLR